jgi:DNA-binding transcriptional ArsR family regulator
MEVPSGVGADDSTFGDDRQDASRRIDERHSTNRLTIEATRNIFNHMVENRLDTTFHALADPTRRGMLANLALGEKSIGELAEPFRMTFAGASKHVKVLEDAGLIERRKVGRTHLIRIDAKPLEEAERWLRQWEKFWNVRLDRLEALINRDKEKENDNG